MGNDLMLNIDKIKVIQGSIIFPEYDAIKENALALADAIKTVDVTDENIKHSKKMLAAVNKKLKQLEDERIKIKKTMLEPYQLFESQVKEIVGIVKDADAIVRHQVKNLEEKEKDEKKQILQRIFEKRKVLYTIGDLLEFEAFLKPNHLNKTTSIDAAEKDMIDFLERTEKDIKVIQGLNDTNAHVSAYLKTFDLADTINHVKQEKARIEAIEASKASAKLNEAEKIYTFAIFSEKDKTILEMYMAMHNIKYKILEG